MNYKLIYFSLIEKGNTENGIVSSLTDTKPHSEIHHITPVLWGGNNHSLNLVRLTYRQHYIAHKVLSRVMGTPCNMVGSNSHQYQKIRTQARETLIQAMNRADVLERLSRSATAHNSRTKSGVTQSKESSEKRSATLKAKTYTCPHCGKSGGGGLLRWHFDNCRKAPVSLSERL